MVFERCRGPYGSEEMLENEETGLTHVCQTTLSYPRDELDTVDVDPLADVFAEKLPVTDTFYHGTVSSDEGDISDSDDGSIEDHERNTWVDWCDSAFRNLLNLLCVCYFVSGLLDLDYSSGKLG